VETPRSDSPAPGGAVVRAVLVAAFLLALAPLCVFPVSDSDTWWHLATGELILETRAIPDADPFSFTAAGRSWITHEWLAQVIGAAAVRAGGLTALILLKVAVVLGAFGILAALAVRRGAPLAPVLLLLLLAASLGPDRYSERPQVATLLFFAGFLSLLLDFRDTGRDLLLALPPLAALWANLHSGFVFGLALAGVFAADAVLRRKRARRLIVVLALCVAAAMLNPNGYHALLYPLEILTNPHYATVTAEYQPIHLAELKVHTHVAVFAAMVGLGVAAAAAGRAGKGKWAPLPLFLFALFAVAALRANRNRELFAVAAVPLLIEPFCDVPRRVVRGFLLRLRRAAGSPAFAGAAAVVLLGLGAHGMARGVRLSEGYRRAVGLGAGPGAPSAATDFVRSAGLQGNPFHEMRFGGWMIHALYPGHRVFIDGRQLLYGKDVFDDYVRILGHGPGFPALVDRFGIEWTLLRNPAVRANPAGYDPYPPLAAALSGDPDWALVYFDERVLIHVRRSPANAAALRDRELCAVDPLTPSWLAAGVDPMGDEADRDAVLRDVATLFARSPDDPFVRLVAASAAGQAGDVETALPVLESLLRGAAGVHRPQCRDAVHELGRSLLRRERGRDAVPYLRLLREVSPRDPAVLNDLGVALAMSGDAAGARDAWEAALAAEPTHAGARDNLARLENGGE
jgi:hypothetical protein